MRESIGGAFQFNLVLIFLGIYIAVLAFAVVYARAFNTKNHVITLIEQHEGFDRAETLINNYMATRSNVAVDDNQCCNIFMDKYDQQAGDCEGRVEGIQGGCVFEFSDVNTKTHYYVVTTFMQVDIPVIGALAEFWPISGETKVLYDRG